MLPGEQDLPVDDLTTVCCDRCGVYDASLRHSSHPNVISFLAAADESARVGIFCARCRGMIAAKATAISLLGGWWSLRGPKLTVAAIRTNLQGGEQSPAANAAMLQALARREYEAKNLPMASKFARESQAVKWQPDTGRLIHELNRAGHRVAHPASPWRFAPFAPLIVIPIFVVAVVSRVLVSETEPVTEVRQVAATDQMAAIPLTVQPAPRRAAVTGSPADNLESWLTPESDTGLARQYFEARLLEARTEIAARVRRGEEIESIKTTIAALPNQPAVARLLKDQRLSTAYQTLLSALSSATRYYRVGAPVEVIERTANELLDVTVDVGVDAIIANVRGHTERGEKLGSEFNTRAEGIEEMKRELRIRGAVIAETNRAITECLSAF